MLSLLPESASGSSTSDSSSLQPPLQYQSATEKKQEQIKMFSLRLLEDASKNNIQEQTGLCARSEHQHQHAGSFTTLYFSGEKLQTLKQFESLSEDLPQSWGL